MVTLEKRLEKLEAVRIRAQRHTASDEVEYARRGQWLVSTIERICGGCPERTSNDSDVIFIDLLTCTAGQYVLHCKAFSAALLSRHDSIEDEWEKNELMELYAWLNGYRLRDDWMSSRDGRRFRS